MATLAEIRAKLKEQETRNSGKGNSSDSASYAFWNLKEGGEATVRFLPDGNKDNTFFWVERSMIKLTFAGVKGTTDNKIVSVNVPCMEMYNETCPILSEIRPWFKDPALEAKAKSYWKKRSYIFQGFVVEDGLKEEAPPENPIRRFMMGPQIFPLIKAALLDPEMDELPTDYVNGVDFKLVKTSKGGYADYSTSKWSRRSRPLTPEECGYIEQYNLFTLNDYLPKKPTPEGVAAIAEMFAASVDGEAYDLARWGNFFKPFGVGGNSKANDDEFESPPQRVNSSPARAAPVTVVQPTVPEYDDPPFNTDDKPSTPSVRMLPQEETKPAASGSRAEDILALIRNRQKQ